MNKQVLIYVISYALIGCSVNTKSDDITYSFDNELYPLAGECISKLKQIDNTVNGSHVIYVRLKESANCAEKLNILFENNVNKHVITYFNKKIISKTYISSSINSANGYHMVIPNRAISEDIILHYRHSIFKTAISTNVQTPTNAATAL